MINVVNKKTHKPTDADIYIGRPSPLGNPYSSKAGTLAKFQVKSVEESIESYRRWLWARIEEKDPAVIKALAEILSTEKKFGTINLVCWCAPAPCHGDVIKAAVHWMATLE